MRAEGRTYRIKRAIDLSGAVLGFAVLTPVMLIIAVRVWRDVGWPIFFRQTRPGWYGEPFRLVKFRTMRDERGADGQLLSDAERLTGFGRILRRTSLDELPELWNVLRGEMSFVGPRPLLMEYGPYFREEERVRFAVRPGITGLAQVNGRNHASWDQRLADDIWYVQHWSLWLDIKILARTVVMVLRRQGVVEDARSIMANLDEERSR